MDILKKINYDRAKITLRVVSRDSSERGPSVSFEVLAGTEAALDEFGNVAVISLSSSAVDWLSQSRDIEIRE